MGKNHKEILISYWIIIEGFVLFVIGFFVGRLR
jgi:hypothetical protein